MTSSLLHQRALAEIAASGQVARALKAGVPAPAFVLRDGHGHAVASALKVGQGPLALLFCCGAWCALCRAATVALAADLPAIAAAGASALVIAPQIWATGGDGVTQLLDPGNRVGGSFGLRVASPDYLRACEHDGALRAGTLHEKNGVLMPARYVIDRGGVIVYAAIDPLHEGDNDPADLLGVIQCKARRRASTTPLRAL